MSSKKVMPNQRGEVLQPSLDVQDVHANRSRLIDWQTQSDATAFVEPDWFDYCNAVFNFSAVLRLFVRPWIDDVGEASETNRRSQTCTVQDRPPSRDLFTSHARNCGNVNLRRYWWPGDVGETPSFGCLLCADATVPMNTRSLYPHKLSWSSRLNGIRKKAHRTKAQNVEQWRNN